MAHDVTFKVPARSLGRSDVTFEVKKDGAILGTLTVSQGSLVWFPTSTRHGYKMSWSRFDSLVQDNIVTGEYR